MAINMIDNLRQALVEGMRSTKYEIQILNPLAGSMQNATLLAKATSFPAKTLNYVEVWTQGRKHLIQGDTEFEHEWTVSFFDNEQHSLRNDFLLWMEALDDPIKNTSQKDYEGSALVLQLAQKDNTSQASYSFHKLWPKTVGAIELADEGTNVISSFDVTFAFDYWEKDKGPLDAGTSANDIHVPRRVD